MPALRDSVDTAMLDALAKELPLDEALLSSAFEGWMVWPVAELIGRLAPADPETFLPFMAA